MGLSIIRRSVCKRSAILLVALIFLYQSFVATALATKLQFQLLHNDGVICPLSLSLLRGHSNNNADCENNVKEDTQSPLESARSTTLIHRNNQRRNFLIGLTTITTTMLSSQQSTYAIGNPLNLKGTFWETGQLYEKSKNPIIDEDGDFLSILENYIEAFHSPSLTNAIQEGKYGTASRLLRGGMISESKLRLVANALIETIPEEKDEDIYKCNESFRLFLRYLDVLDYEVRVASQPSLGGGGEDDPRMKILTRLGETEDALKIFLKNIQVAL